MARGDAAVSSTTPCRYCGAVPTKVCSFVGYYSTTYLAFGTKWGRPPTWGARGPMCRSCALAVGRHLQTATLNAGWWGLWDLLIAPFFVCWNTFALRRANAMPSGEGTPHTLHPGFPVHQRPLWGLVGLIDRWVLRTRGQAWPRRCRGGSGAAWPRPKRPRRHLRPARMGDRFAGAPERWSRRPVVDDVEVGELRVAVSVRWPRD